jgi:hypothetical protein
MVTSVKARDGDGVCWRRKVGDMRKVLLVGIAICVGTGVVLTASPSAFARPHKIEASSHIGVGNVDPVIYDSTVQPNPGNLPSQSYEATATTEFGNQITFGGAARVLDNVTVQLSSWGCESGNWSTYTTAPCVTTPGATFTEPITFSIYNVGQASAAGPSTVGGPVASVTQTFSIPYRPSADTNYATDCAAEAASENPPVSVSAFAGTWYDSDLNKCFNGYLTPITFNFGHVVLPNSVIYGIAYNTSDNGSPPYGDATACHSSPGGCGYDSLNVALSQEPTAPSVGGDAYPGTTYLNVDQQDYAVNSYCDGGAAGINTLRIDEPANYPTGNGTTSGCWSVGSNKSSPWYVPAVQFNAVPSTHAIITSANTANVVAGTFFSFTVTTDGVPAPRITARGRMPKGITFTDNGNGTGTISGTAFATNRNGNYRVTLRAQNLPTGGRNRQLLTLVLSGGR